MFIYIEKNTVTTFLIGLVCSIMTGFATVCFILASFQNMIQNFHIFMKIHLKHTL